MSRLISKTIFQEFLFCPKNTWLKLHKPELLEKFVLSDFEQNLIEQGNEVETVARNLFPGGIEVKATGEHAQHETVRLMAAKVPAIFQATYIADGFIARNDILKYDAETGLWDLYEVKATNSLKEGDGRDHITDVAFQVSLLRRAHIPLGCCFLVHLNKEYRRAGALDLKQLFVFEDVTEAARARMSDIESKMSAAREYLLQEEEPTGGCECLYKTRRSHCTTFKHSHSHIPDYSVHDISRIHKTKLQALVEKSIFGLDDIDDPEAHGLTEKQSNQVWAHKRQESVVEHEKIAEELSALAFPLYFFDYEAYAPAIPVFDGYSPYKHIPFQFSLHILREPDGELEPVGYLHKTLSDPAEAVAALLQKHIIGGTVIVWHKTFEMGVNKDLGYRLPQYAAFLERLNGSIYDLESIFTQQLYVHHGFKGRSSIKKILPVIAPELSYDELGIKEGGQASNAWWQMVSPGVPPEERAAIAKGLEIYCERDTYAMYAIWKHLQEVSRGEHVERSAHVSAQ